MIVEKILEGNLVRHYSDSLLKIRQVETGAVYDEAVDVIPCRYTYEETDLPIDDDEATPEEVAAALEAIL